MGELFDSYDVLPVKGSDITIGKNFPEIFVSDTDEVFCYFGICLAGDECWRKSLFMHPHYMQGRHSTDKEISKEIQGFYRIADGCIVLDQYVDNRFGRDRTYKKIEVGIKLLGPYTYYAVLMDRKEEENLTRAVFGLTHKEITQLLDAYAKVMGTCTEYITYPKLTRSMKATNYCDMVDLWIPETFPYIAFCESGYDFSHVSLWGFYRHIQLLTGCMLDSVFSQVLMKAGASEKVLKQVFNVGRAFYSQTKVTRTVLMQK